MSLFEFTFALSAVILGLALTHMAAVLHKLLLAGRRVKWAAEPALLTMIVMLVIVTVWLGAWFNRNETTVSVGWIVLEVLKLLTLYIAAASCLPEVAGREPVDLHDYYDRTRRLSFGALILSYALFEIADVVADGVPQPLTLGAMVEWFLFPVLYGLLIFIRARWFNVAALAFALLFYGYVVSGLRLSSG